MVFPIADGVFPIANGVAPIKDGVFAIVQMIFPIGYGVFFIKKIDFFDGRWRFQAIRLKGHNLWYRFVILR